MRVLDSHVHWFDLNEYGETWYKGWPSKTDKGLSFSDTLSLNNLTFRLEKVIFPFGLLQFIKWQCGRSCPCSSCS